jgi:hypothetical protein
VSFAQDAAILANQRYAQDTAVLELQREWQTNPISGIAGWIEIDGAFDAVKAGNRQTGVVDECLVPGDRVLYRAQSRTIQDQFSAAREFFDEFHHLRLITRLSRTIQ